VKQPRRPPVLEWLHKLIHLYLGILLSNEKERTFHMHITWLDPKHIMLGEEKNAISKGYVLYNCLIYLTFLKGQNYKDEHYYNVSELLFVKIQVGRDRRGSHTYLNTQFCSVLTF
jgi:hypothetical protein